MARTRIYPCLYLISLALILVACGSGDAQSTTGQSTDQAPMNGEIILERVGSEEAAFQVVGLLDSLEHPWAVDWLPDGRMLISERPGRMVLVDGESTTSLEGVPEVWAENQGGLLDVRVAPNYEETGWIYFTYSMQDDGVGGTVLSRARLEGAALTGVEEIYRQTPFLDATLHYGSRIAFIDDGTLVVTLGERGQRLSGNSHSLPSSSTSLGTIVRLNLDGSIPEDNPFVGSNEGLPEVYSYGHRNQQGMAVHPETGTIWQNEHGPHGGDELNLVTAGSNYGWPAATHGDTYRTPREAIGSFDVPGTVQPVEYWDPSPGLSGLEFYTGDEFPNWRNDLFMGALAQSMILRLELNANNEVTHQEELLRGEIGRIRDLATGPDGYLYFLTDASDGGLYRLEPTDSTN